MTRAQLIVLLGVVGLAGAVYVTSRRRRAVPLFEPRPSNPEAEAEGAAWAREIEIEILSELLE